MNNHIGDANKMVGAAQEPAAWVPPSFFDNGVVAATARRKPPSETAVAMRGEYVPLYAAPVAAAPDEMSPEFTDTARAAIAWVLWHHLGGSSPVGQPLRFALGMGDHDPMPDWRIAEAKRYAELAGATTADFHKGRASTPAAPGIDLEQFRDAVDCWESVNRGARDCGVLVPELQRDAQENIDKAIELRALIDASSKGGSHLIAVVREMEHPAVDLLEAPAPDVIRAWAKRIKQATSAEVGA